MKVSIRIDESLYREASLTAKVECRSVPHQIEFWAKIGQMPAFQQMLLAYEWDSHARLLLMLGVHENFYQDLKNKR